MNNPLGVKLPLIQAPMAGAQDAELTVAVCNAGALGSLPGAVFDARQLREQLQFITSHTAHPYNVNFFCHSVPVEDPNQVAAWHQTLAPYYAVYEVSSASIPTGAARQPFSDEVLNVLAEFEPSVVSFHFGLPGTARLEAIKNWGGAVLSSATTPDEASWLEDHGADMVIAQGWGAGGHRGHFLSDELSLQLPTSSLVEQIIDRVSIPVVAAGGIGHAGQVREMLALGAAAAQVGTAFLLCDETKTNGIYRAALQSDRALDTEVTNVFTGRPARGIVNRLIREQGPLSSSAPEFPLAANAVAPLRMAAEAQGLDDFSTLWCGEYPQGCAAIPAAQMVQRLCQSL